MNTSSTSKNFFSLEKILKKYNVDWTIDSFILCINSIRNVGKTTDVLKWTMDKVDINNKVGFFRNSEEQLKTFRQDFNNRFLGRFMISGSVVYNVIKVEIQDDQGETQYVYKKNELVGYVGSLSAYTKIKSIEAANIRFIIFDEYNEDSLKVRNIYVKWINMLKTLSRFSKVFCIMLGNRDTPNNEFMVKWGVIPSDQDFVEDYAYKFSKRGLFIELGSLQFANLGNDDTLANELARFDKDSERYLQGGYARKSYLQVVPYFKVIHDTFDPLFKIAMKDDIYAFGEFKHEKYGDCYALVIEPCALENANAQKLVTYAIDSAAYQITETKLNNQESQYAIIEKLMRLHKKKKLFYDTFDSMVHITDKMVAIKY